ncbi:unnamed protein product, partial [Mesorhabditis belari]|uniref:Hexosyltransferase n=1 Tax=Mesorhabditis belari TaxID=2138241 RepID=A0AAF3EYF2_9BILA
MQEQCTDGPSSARGQPAPKKFPDGPPAESYQKKRFSVPAKLAPIVKAGGERRVTLVRPCESFREAKEKHAIHFGYAALNTEFNDSDPTCSNDSGCSVFTIFTGEEQRHTVCQQPVGPQADLFISTLSDKSKSQLKKFLDNTPRQDNEYFVWVRETSSQVVTVLSIKTLENHLKSKSGIRRVKWRHLSAERLSIYRYSLPSIGGKGARVRECVFGHRKLCLLFIWLLFVLLICITVVIGSTNGNDLALNGTNYAHQHHNLNRCNETFLLSVILSSPSNFDIRQTIRNTWASRNQDEFRSGSIQTIFLIGSGDLLEKRLLEREADDHRDILMVSFQDTYRNLVLKSLSLLYYHEHFCQARFLLKIDDDVVFSFPRFMHFFNDTTILDQSAAIYGKVWNHSRPERDPRHRWYISLSAYTAENLPPFCSGPSYVMNRQAVHALLNKTQSVEDVFITGILAEYVGVKRVQMNRSIFPRNYSGVVGFKLLL